MARDAINKKDFLYEINATAGILTSDLEKVVAENPNSKISFSDGNGNCPEIAGVKLCGDILVLTTRWEDKGVIVSELYEELRKYDAATKVVVDFNGPHMLEEMEDDVEGEYIQSDEEYGNCTIYVSTNDIRLYKSEDLFSALERDIPKASSMKGKVMCKFPDGCVGIVNYIAQNNDVVYINVDDDSKDYISISDFIDDLNCGDCGVVVFNRDLDGECYHISIAEHELGKIFYESGENDICFDLGTFLKDLDYQDDEDEDDDWDDDSNDEEEEEDDDDEKELGHKWIQMIKEARRMIGEAECLDELHQCVDLVLPPAMAGVPIAMFMMALMNQIMENKEQAKNWSNVLMALDQDNEDADVLFVKGQIFANGIGSYEENIETALSYYKASAEKGNLEALCAIAELYFVGEGVMKDPKVALMWAKKAYEANDPAGLFIYGRAYYEGAGVAKDKTIGKKLLRQAASMTDSDSMGSCDAAEYIEEHEL